MRGALIVALTIPFSLLFAAICLDLRHIPANLLSLGALDFGMVVDGAVVMVENIVRHLAAISDADDTRTPMEKIRAAAHEVQRPVFYAIGIIITAYLPIFTLQRVEGRLFKPMAWTVAFALLGALMFSMLLAPVLVQPVVPQRHEGMAQPADDVADRALSLARWAVAIRWRWVTLGSALAGVGIAVYLATSVHRLRVPAASGRRRDLGARHAGAQHRTDRRHPHGESGAHPAVLVSGGHRSAPARWDGPTTAPTPPASSIPNISWI